MDSSRTREVTFGRSLIVPSVQELVTKQPLLTKLPPRYNQHSLVSATANSSSLSVPVINLQSLTNGDAAELDTLHTACQQWGFFQVVQHGVSSLLLEDFKREIFNFFELPMDEKKKLWQQPENHEGFGQLFVVSDTQKLDWSDMFYITTLPSNLRRPHLFEHLPPNLRETLEAYSLEVKKLAMTILGHIAKALKMDEEEMREMFSDGVQSMRMNYYPPCPEPDKAIGFTPHSDADALTILFQLNETEGLQIRKDGRWLPVKPLPDAFVVNLGDVMEIVSNGVYQSIEHRATVNSTTERLSVATFYSSNMDCELGPARSLIGPDKPAVYRRVPIETYFKEFFARKLDGKAYMDFMKTEEHVTT